MFSNNDDKFNDYVIRYGNYSKNIDDLTKSIQEKEGELKELKDIDLNEEKRKYNKSFKQKMVLYNDHMNAYIHYLNLYIRQNIIFNVLQNIGDYAYSCNNLVEHTCNENPKTYRNAMSGISKLNILGQPDVK